jgi:hypothetical protein
MSSRRGASRRLRQRRARQWASAHRPSPVLAINMNLGSAGTLSAAVLFRKRTGKARLVIARSGRDRRTRVAGAGVLVGEATSSLMLIGVGALSATAGPPSWALVWNNDWHEKGDPWCKFGSHDEARSSQKAKELIDLGVRFIIINTASKRNRRYDSDSIDAYIKEARIAYLKEQDVKSRRNTPMPGGKGSRDNNHYPPPPIIDWDKQLDRLFALLATMYPPEPESDGEPRRRLAVQSPSAPRSRPGHPNPPDHPWHRSRRTQRTPPEPSTNGTNGESAQKNAQTPAHV